MDFKKEGDREMNDTNNALKMREIHAFKTSLNRQK